jgi:hypothetical protein
MIVLPFRRLRTDGHLALPEPANIAQKKACRKSGTPWFLQLTRLKRDAS